VAAAVIGYPFLIEAVVGCSNRMLRWVVALAVLLVAASVPRRAYSPGSPAWADIVHSHRPGVVDGRRVRDMRFPAAVVRRPVVVVVPRTDLVVLPAPVGIDLVASAVWLQCGGKALLRTHRGARVPARCGAPGSEPELTTGPPR